MHIKSSSALYRRLYVPGSWYQASYGSELTELSTTVRTQDSPNGGSNHNKYFDLFQRLIARRYSDEWVLTKLCWQLNKLEVLASTAKVVVPFS